MTYGDFKELTRITASDKLLHDKVSNIAKNSKYDGYQRYFAPLFYTSFHIKTSATCANKFSGSGIKKENISNKELAEKLHKQIIGNFRKRILQSFFIENVWCAYFVDMQLICKFNKLIFFIMCYWYFQ